MKAPGEFWDSRAQELGHTGCADPIVYRYDQPLRVRAVRRAIRRLRVDLEGRRALDLGCGTGDVAVALRDLGARATGVDVSVQVLSRARPRLPGGVVAAEVQQQPFLAGQFDVVTSVTVLQHVLEPAELDRAIGEIARVLTPGGVLVMLEIAPVDESAGPPHLRVRTRDDWARALRGRGLEPIFEWANPQWGLAAIRRLSGAASSTASDGAPSRGGPLSILKALAKRLVLAITWPLDHVLFRAYPSRCAYYRILGARRA